MSRTEANYETLAPRRLLTKEGSDRLPSLGRRRGQYVLLHQSGEVILRSRVRQLVSRSEQKGTTHLENESAFVLLGLQAAGALVPGAEVALLVVRGASVELRWLDGALPGSLGAVCCGREAGGSQREAPRQGEARPK